MFEFIVGPIGCNIAYIKNLGEQIPIKIFPLTYIENGLINAFIIIQPLPSGAAEIVIFDHTVFFFRADNNFHCFVNLFFNIF